MEEISKPSTSRAPQREVILDKLVMASNRTRTKDQNAFMVIPVAVEALRCDKIIFLNCGVTSFKCMSHVVLLKLKRFSSFFS